MPDKERSIALEDVLLFLLRHPLRRRLLRLYVEAKDARELRSPKELTVPVNEDVSKVGWHVRELEKYGAVELVAEEQRRGAVEHFYEATSLVDEIPWARSALGLA